MNTDTLSEKVRAIVAGLNRPAVIAISGAAALGKSTFAISLAQRLFQFNGERVSIISTDGFLADRQRRKADRMSGYDSAAMDIERLGNSVETLLSGHSVLIPVYDHSSGMVIERATLVCPGDVTIIEGIHSLHPRILKNVNYSVFFDSDQRTAVRLRNYVDVTERGYKEENVQETAVFEHEAYQRHVGPERYVANIVVRVRGRWKYSILQG